MTLEEMKKRRTELGYTYSQLAKLSGVPESTIQKIFSGTTEHPRFETLRALERVLEDSGKYTSSANAVHETSAPYNVAVKYPHQGSYTLNDYYALPEDQRAELIDGVIYDMSSPVPVHQLIAAEVHYQISNFIRSHHGSCIPFISPIDVQLDRDNHTMVQPDVIIVCKEELITDKNIYGAPDFVLEVISPSTRKKDYTKKLEKYDNAGVREYWLIDPYKRMVFVYFFEDDTLCPAIYPIEANIPMNLYDGELQINLKEILRWLPKES